MKWIKFLKDYKTYKIGQVDELDDGIADVLIDTKQAEAAEKPKEIDAAVTGISKTISDSIAAQVTAGIDAGMKALATTLQKATDDKRPRDIKVGDNGADDPRLGFKTGHDQIRSVIKWYQQDQAARDDDRMKRLVAMSTKAPSTYANEGLGADGGFLLAPQFGNEVLAFTFDDESLYGRTDNYTTGSNNLTLPRDETTPWGTNGVQVYWTAEAAQATQSKLKIGQTNLILEKLTALVPCTDEMLQDSFVGLGQYITRQAGERIRWAVDEAIVNGGGAGKPLGFLNSGAIVSQAKVTSQTAATVNLTNCASMISRIPSSSLRSLVWLCHPSVLPQLMIMTNGNNSLWIASGEIEGKGPMLGRFMGIPLVPSQHCQILGTQGDIFLVDLSQYVTLSKGDGIQTAMSMHLFFDYNVSTFRFNFRCAGRPWQSSYFTSAYGSFTQSPFVTLDTRS